MSEDKFKLLLRKEIGKHGSLRSYARHAKVEPSVISDYLNGKRASGIALPLALGYRKVTTYEKVEAKP